MRILLFQPLYRYDCNCLASAAFWNALGLGTNRTANHIVDTMLPIPNSLLPHCFNQGWAAARNAYEAGTHDAFAMIHSDIAVAPGWLEVMANDLLAANVDILSAGIPLKEFEEKGLTSTALDTGNRWAARRLTLKELHSLPEIFTSADAVKRFGMPLLINTGLWICKLGDWCLYTHFDFENAIARIGGQWQAIVVPEDWHFSRQCHQLGLSLAVTRKIAIEHYGDGKWNNQQVRGWETDRPEAAPAPAWTTKLSTDR